MKRSLGDQALPLGRVTPLSSTLTHHFKFYGKDKEKSQFIRKYLIGRNVWQDAYFKLHIERRTFFQWKDEILSDAVIIAVKENLIKLAFGDIDDESAAL